jgi:hypothetical protein
MERLPRAVYTSSYYRRMLGGCENLLVRGGYPPSHVRTSSTPPGGQLLGRQRERVALGRLLNAALDGDGGVLAVYGSAPRLPGVASLR